MIIYCKKYLKIVTIEANVRVHSVIKHTLKLKKMDTMDTSKLSKRDWEIIKTSLRASAQDSQELVNLYKKLTIKDDSRREKGLRDSLQIEWEYEDLIKKIESL